MSAGRFASPLVAMRWPWLLPTLVALACAQPPTKEIDMTSARVARARAVDAHIYAEGLLNEAEAALADAREHLGAKRYHAAVKAAALACGRADEAYARSILRKQRMERRAKRQLREIAALLDQARARGIDPTSVKPLAVRLRELEQSFRRGGPPHEIFEAGAELKNRSLELLTAC